MSNAGQISNISDFVVSKQHLYKGLCAFYLPKTKVVFFFFAMVGLECIGRDCMPKNKFINRDILPGGKTRLTEQNTL